MAKNINTDVVRLGVGHALILGNLPEAVKLEQLNKILMEQSQADIASFGLFEASSPNYTTFYPEVTPEMLMPKEDEFIKPVFRALSEVIVHKKYNPIDFGQNGVLRDSMKLLKGQTVNMDHETMTGNAVGAVAEVSWEEGYKVGDVNVPAGINAVLKIDGKSNPRIARAIQMDPPSIHSTSVTVEFEFEQSHPKMPREEFYSKLGTFDEKGVLIRRVVTKVKRYHEISLVNHGADPFAQLIKKDGKINNPKFAHITYNNAQEEKIIGNYFFMDFKRLGDKDYTDIVLNSAIPDDFNNNDTTTQNSESMKQILLALAAAYGLSYSLGENEELTAEQLEAIKTAALRAKTDGETASSQLAEKTNALTALQAKYDELSAQSGEITKLVEFKNEQITALRTRVINTLNIITNNAPAAGIVDNINKTTDFAALQAMLTTYEQQLEEKMPATCKDCGSKEISRASAQAKPTNEGEGKTELSNEEAMAKLRKKSTVASQIHGVNPTNS